MKARLFGIDAMLLGGGVVWIGPGSEGPSPLGALPPPPDRFGIIPQTQGTAS
jgi:hypothetical protein